MHLDYYTRQTELKLDSLSFLTLITKLQTHSAFGLRFPFSRNMSLANPWKLRVALTYDQLEPEDEKVACVAGKEIEKIWNPLRKSRFSNPTVAGWLLIQQFSEYEYDALLTFFY